MGKLLEATFFSDKIRGLVTLFLLVLIAGFVVFQTFFPHKPTLDNATLNSLQEVTQQLRKAAQNLETAGQSQAELNESLKQKLSDLSSDRNKGYEELLKQYGLDVDLPTNSNVGKPSGVQQRSDDLRRKPVPASAVPAGPNKHVQGATSRYEEATDPGDTGGEER